MSLVTWIFFAVAAFVAILAIAFVVLTVLNWWYDRNFCEDKE